MVQPHSVENNPNILDVPPDADEVGLVVRVAGTVATTGGGGPSTVTADQGDPNTNANGWPVKITDGVDTVLVSSIGELLALVTQGTSPWVVSGTVAVSSLPEPVSVDDNGGSLTVDGTVAATQGTTPWVVGDGGGSITIDGTVSVVEPVSVDDNGGSLTVDGTVAVSNFPATQPVSGTVTADTELPAAAALTDATANPTTPMVGAALMGFDGTDWERLRFAVATALATDRGLIVRDFEQAIASGALALRTDDTGTVTYVGNAVPASLTSGAVWRIRRVTESGVAPNIDYTIEFADGNNLFDNIWDNRAALSYS